MAMWLCTVCSSPNTCVDLTCVNKDCQMPANRVGTSMLSKSEVRQKIESIELEEDLKSILIVKEKTEPSTPEKMRSYRIEIDLDELAHTVCELCG